MEPESLIFGSGFAMIDSNDTQETGEIMDYYVKTPCGELQGTAGRVPGVAAYKGIRYATAGRWEYPKQVTAWEGVYDATQYGNCS